MSDYVEPKKKGWMPWVIGCGLAMLVVVLGLGGFGYYLFTTSFITDPKEAAALTQDISPGATMPTGYAPVFGVDLFGVKMVVIGPPDLMLEDPGRGGTMRTDRTRFLLASAEKGMNDKTMREMGSGKKDDLDESSVEQLGTETFSIGGIDRIAEKSRFNVDDTTQLSYRFDLGKMNGKACRLIVIGPEKSIDLAAMKTFLTGVGKPAVDPSVEPPPEEQPEKEREKKPENPKAP